MKILLLQLSDIHIRGDADPVLARGQEIVNAVKNADYDINLCVIALTGDIAFSGTQAQYAVAKEFIGRIRDHLSVSLRNSPEVECVMVPGNHDCDFSTRLLSRDLILRAIMDSPPSEIDASLVETCTKVQDHFFELRDSFARGLSAPSRLYYEYRYQVGETSILFRCCNTAWISQLHEQPGTLYFPKSALLPDEHSSTIAITILHHPYNWLVPSNSRILRKEIEALSDIILTGHEHDYTKRSQAGLGGQQNLYIEAAALQESRDPKESGFNAIILDTAEKKEQIVNFTWTGQLFIPGEGLRKWEDLQVNKLRSRSQYDLSEKQIAHLEDPGVVLTHPSKERIALSDIFVYPDLREVTLQQNELSKMVAGENLIEIMKDQGAIMVTGAEKSGKSSFAKRLFRDFHESGSVPLLLNGASLDTHTPAKLSRLLDQAFTDQYGVEGLEHYRQLDPERRVVIVDDYHRTLIRAGSNEKLLSFLSKHAGRVVLIADNLAQQVFELAGRKGDSTQTSLLPHFQILPFGHVRRDEIAERWYSLNDSAELEPTDLARKLVEAKNLTDTAIGRNFVPSYPVFLLSVLQAQDQGQAVNVNASAYGYYYELLIRTALAIGSSKEDFDVRVGYLSYCAYQMHVRGMLAISEAALLEIHNEYVKVYGIPLSFVRTQESLVQAKLLSRTDDCYEFKYGYIFYYFVARYIADHISDENVKKEIVRLSSDLHEERNANILLFLSHLSKHPIIIERMLDRARAVFRSYQPALLRPEDIPAAAIDQVIREIVYEERPVRESRRTMLQQMDAAEHAPGSDVADDPELAGLQDYLKELGIAFKTMQILGQLLKNFPGSMEADTKRKITEECYQVGLRTLGSFFETLRRDTGSVIEHIMEAVRQKYPDAKDDVLLHKAKVSLFGLTFLSAYSMVRRISSAVGSPHLLTIYREIRDRQDAPVTDLITAALQLDQQGSFPVAEIIALSDKLSDNPIAQTILRQVVVSHFHLFNIGFEAKQRICSGVGIQYKKVQGANPNTKLIGPKET